MQCVFTDMDCLKRKEGRKKEGQHKALKHLWLILSIVIYNPKLTRSSMGQFSGHCDDRVYKWMCSCHVKCTHAVVMLQGWAYMFMFKGKHYGCSVRKRDKSWKTYAELIFKDLFKGQLKAAVLCGNSSSQSTQKTKKAWSHCAPTHCHPTTLGCLIILSCSVTVNFFCVCRPIIIWETFLLSLNGSVSSHNHTVNVSQAAVAFLCCYSGVQAYGFDMPASSKSGLPESRAIP